MANQKKTTTKKKTPSKAKKQVTQFADGRESIADRETKAKTIESLLEVKSRDPFHVASGEQFEDAVSSMGLTELQEVAVQAGVFPSGTKATLKNKLTKEYQNRNQGIYGTQGSTQTILESKSERAKKLLKLLNE